MATAEKDEQAEPFLANDRSSFDIELLEPNAGNRVSLDGGQDDPAGDAHHVKPESRKDRTFALLVGVALVVTVLGFVINTEATEYFESELGWKKPMASMYMMHSSLSLPWIIYMLIQRFGQCKMTTSQWLRTELLGIGNSIRTISAYRTSHSDGAKAGPGHLFRFFLPRMGLLTVVLTASGVSWFVALAWTTPADLTAIYNCSTFFAAAFSVPLLKERLGLYSIVAVGLSIIGTFVIAYGDTTAKHDPGDKVGTSRLFGNIVACIGALAFGLYEVLFKKWADSAEKGSPQESLPLTLFASALTGFYTMVFLWPGLLALHLTGVEPFIWPSAQVWLWIVVAVISGAISITLLALLIVWTDPVFGSFANVLSVFFVALSDWIVFGLTPSLATYVGGGLVIVAFSLLTWDTFIYGKR